MGLLSTILGENNPVAQFAGSNHNWLSALGSGLASGPTFQQGLSNAVQMGPQGQKLDDAYAIAQQEKQARQEQINQTAKYLQSNPAFADLVPLAQSGQGAEALTEAFRRQAASQKIDTPQPPQYIKQDDGSVLVAQDGKITPGYTPPQAVTQSTPTVSFTDAGVPDPTQQADFLKSLDPQYANIVKGVANYELDPTRITSMRGDQRQKLIEAAKAYDPSFDMSQFPARSAMRKSITSGTYSQTLNSANLVIQHLDELKKAGEALNNKGGLGTLLNAPSNALKGMTGDPTITRFDEAKQAVGAELAKVFKGSGVSDVGSIEEWKNTFNNANAPEQLQQAISTAVTLLKSRIDTIQNQYQSAMGKPANFAYLTPHSKQVLTDLGIDPSALDSTVQSQGGDQSVDDLVNKYLKQ